MILDSTHTKKSHKQIITDLIGKPFSFFESIRLGGVGSKKMIIHEVSPNLQPYLNTGSNINYATIEMRSDGILVFINKRLKNFIWIIPYYQLAIYKANGISIHAQGTFIHLKTNKVFKENKSFLDKLLNKKVAYDERFKFQF